MACACERQELRGEEEVEELILARAERGEVGAQRAEVEPDDAAASHPDVAGVRVGVEEAVVNNLLDVVLAEPPPEMSILESRFP